MAPARHDFASQAMRYTLGITLLLVVLPVALQPKSRADERLRVLIETDAGGDPDDEQSLVRFLLYSNEWDVEGIICNRAMARDRENRNPERTGLGIVQRLVKAYGECYPNLVRHEPRYPKPEALLRRTVAGYGDSDDGVSLIIAAVDRDDPRPLWYSDWGSDRGSAPVNLKRALDKVLAERGPQGYARFKNRLRLVSYDQFGDHTTKLTPPFKLWVNTFEPPLEGTHWYHRFSALTATAGGFDLNGDMLRGHGPLGALYPANTTHAQKEGDTMTFLYLVPTGLNDPEQPTWGSWAGRYGRKEDYEDRPYYWANLADTWQGTTHRENTLKRWAVHLQNDFKARLDWCVTDFARANHPPVARVGGELRRTVASGQQVVLDASDSTDPDRHGIKFDWLIYPEPGSYRGPAPTIHDAGSPHASFIAPQVDSTQTLHVILTVTDEGSPPLTRYQRVIVTVEPRVLSTSAAEPPPGSLRPSESRTGGQTDPPKRPPNFVILIADDLGWRDVGYHESEIRTPNLDRMAREGVRLERHYVYPTCSPTRAGLLTGRNPSRFGILSPIGGRSTETLPDGTMTLARALKTRGYVSALVGKWHLGLRPEAGPRRFGFDRSYGYLHGQIDPYTHLYKNGDRTWHRDDAFTAEEGHATDLIAAEAVRFLETKREEPFLLWVAFSVPHHPLQEEEKWSARYRDEIADPWRRLYAASVTHMDAAIGRIVEALEKSGKAGETLLLFTSDNGGQRNYSSKAEYGGKFEPHTTLGDNRPLRDWKGSLYEGGVRVPAFVHWRERLRPAALEAPVSVLDWFPTFLRLAGAVSAPEWKIEGKDVWPLLAQEERTPPARTIYWNVDAASAIVSGDWKLILHRAGATELYNISQDAKETKNLAPSKPAKVAELRKLLAAEKKLDSR